MTRTRAAMMMMAAGTTACAVDDAADAFDTLEVRTTIGCSTCGLNGNSAHANLYPIDQLNLFGWPNADGMVILGVKSPSGDFWPLRVKDDEITALDPVLNQTVASGAGLVGCGCVGAGRSPGRCGSTGTGFSTMGQIGSPVTRSNT